MTDTAPCTTCGSEELLKHRLKGAAQDPTRCWLCQELAKRQEEERPRRWSPPPPPPPPPLTATLGDLIFRKHTGRKV